MARNAGDVRRAASAPTGADVDRALSLGRQWSHPQMDEASSLRTIASSTVSPAAQKPRDIDYYLDQNTEGHRPDTLDGLFALQDTCRRLYIHHPMIGTAVDIYSKWPLTGLEFRCKDEELAAFYHTLFMEDLAWEDHLVDVGREYWTTGEALPLGTWNETLRVWERDELIQPRDVDVKTSTFLKEPLLSMRLPEEVRTILTTRRPPEQYQALSQAYPELVDLVRGGQSAGFIPISGHLLKHLAFKADTFFPRGIPIMTRGIRAVLQEEMLNTAQDSIADRLSTPLLLVRLGATATELGTQSPWIPTAGELAAFEDMMNAAMAADFRMMTTHFGVKAESVFGREAMPNFDKDFDRTTERILQVFGMSKTMLSGASSGQTFAADAMNRDLMTQLLRSHQRRMKGYTRDRMLVVAEAHDHFDYEERNGKRYRIMEEVLVVDEKGNKRVEERPKLLVPDLYMKPMNLKDEAKEREEVESLRAAGAPISLRRRMVNREIDLDDEIEASREERIMLAVEEQKTRKQTYLALAKEGLPIPEDLVADFAPRAEEGETQTVTPPAPAPDVVPALGEVEAPIPGLAPVGTDAQDGLAAPDPSMTQQTPSAPLEGRTRPPESDEMRADMPKPASRLVASPDVDPLTRLSSGPSHLKAAGHRVLTPLPGVEEDQDG